MSTGIPYGGAAQRWHDNPLQEEVDSLKVSLGRQVWENKRMQEEVDRLRAALVECHAALLWCGGSKDFQPEGIAAQGWRNVVLPVLKQTDAALGNPHKD
jgi:hypothetical protein